MRMNTEVIAKNYLIQLVSKITSVAIGLITLAIMTRALGDTRFGEFTTAITYLQVVTVVVDLGLTLVFLQMISKPDADKSRISSAFLGLRLISNAIVFAVATALAFATPYNLAIKFAIAVGAISFLSLSTTGMLTGLYQKELMMVRASCAEIAGKIIALVLVVLAAKEGCGPAIMVGALGVGNVLNLILTITLAQNRVRFRPTIDVEIWMSAIAQSWPIGVSIFFNLLYLKSDILVLGFYYPQSEVGVYGAAYRILDVFTALPTMYMGLVLPFMVKAWAQKLKTEFNSHLQRTFDFFAIAVVPLLFGTQLVAVPLMLLVAGSGFERSGIVLPILILALLPIFTGTLTGHAIVALGKQKMMIWGYVATAIVALTGYFVLIPPFGIVAAAWVTVASELLINMLTAAVVIRATRWVPNFTALSKAIAASILMSLVIIAFPNTHVIFTIIVGMASYIVAIVALGGVKISFVKQLLFRNHAEITGAKNI
jgi:O-antigen/teichoic acid export membrane protein